MHMDSDRHLAICDLDRSRIRVFAFFVAGTSYQMRFVDIVAGYRVPDEVQSSNDHCRPRGPMRAGPRSSEPRASGACAGPANQPKFYRRTDYRRPPYIADSLADDFKETPWR